MAFDRPTLVEIRERIQSDLDVRANGGAPYLRRAFENVLAWSVAGVAHGLHGHVEWASLQLLPTTCDETRLASWASMLGVPRKPPTKSEGLASFAGTNGVVVAAGTVMQRRDGVRYVASADATVTSGVATVSVRAESFGAVGNTDGASPLTLVSPISGVSSSGSFTSAGASNGVDLEAVETWRERVLTRMRTTPRGGTSEDYEVWARETPGVTIRDVFVRPLRSGGGTVDLAFTVEGDDPIPTSEVALVQAYVNTKRPADMAGCTVYAPTRQTQPYAIAVRPNTPAVRAAIEAALDDLHEREVGMGDVLLASRVNEAISTAAGELDHVMSIPAANVLPESSDHIVLRGAIDWSTLPEI